jgi:hypothetical protein
MAEMYPQLVVPTGMQLLPRVDYDLLREHLQIRPEQNLYFFPDGKPAFSVPIAMLKPLSRAIVAPERAKASILELHADNILETLPAPTVAHTRQGAFSLWRGVKLTSSPAPEKLLPPSPPPQLPARAKSAKPALAAAATTSPEALPLADDTGMPLSDDAIEIDDRPTIHDSDDVNAADRT